MLTQTNTRVGNPPGIKLKKKFFLKLCAVLRAYLKILVCISNVWTFIWACVSESRFVNAIKVESFHLSFFYLEGHKINLNTQRISAMYILKIRVKRTCRWFVTGDLHLHRKEHDSLWQAHFIAYDFTLWKVCANLLEEYWRSFS